MDYSKLLVGDTLGQAGNTKRRSYAGGFIMPLVAQDARRMLPSLRVLGTGVARAPLAGRELIESWYLVDLQDTTDLSAWWADMEVSIPHDVQQAIVNRNFTAQQEFQAGYDRAATNNAKKEGLPQYVVPPHFRGAAKQAVVAPHSAELLTVAFSAAEERLPTMRGLGSLVESSKLVLAGSAK